MQILLTVLWDNFSTFNKNTQTFYFVIIQVHRTLQRWYRLVLCALHSVFLNLRDNNTISQPGTICVYNSVSSYHMHCFGTLVRNQLLVLVGCFWVLNSVSLIYVSILHTVLITTDVLQSFNHEFVSSHFIFTVLFHSCLSILFFAFSYKFKNNLVYSCKNLAGVFIGITLNLYINLGRIDFFTMLSHP